MQAATLVLAGLAALLHVYIFVLESLRWEAPATRRTFGLSAELAAATKQMAFNQGFYNLFLAVVTGGGIALASSRPDAGTALLAAGTGSMLAAAVVLLASDPTKARAAVTQGLFPLLSLVSLLIWRL